MNEELERVLALAREQLPERIASKLNATDAGCLEWTGSCRRGYGRTLLNGKHVVVHRAIYELVHGSVAAELQLDHLCRNKACANPAHLEPVTGRENTLRGVGPSAINAKKTQCPRGHALAGDNLLMKRGLRACRTCCSMQELAYKRRCIARQRLAFFACNVMAAAAMTILHAERAP